MKRTLLQFVVIALWHIPAIAVTVSYPIDPNSPDGRLFRLGHMASKNESAEANRKIVAEVAEILDSKDGGDMRVLENASDVLHRVARHDQAAAAQAVPALVRRLPWAHGRTQCEAIRALGAIGPEAKPAILYLENLANGKADTYAEFAKSNAIGALARIVPAESRGKYDTMLIERLQDKHDFVRWTAADSLGRLTQTEEIRWALAGAMKDPNVTVRAVAVEAWCRLGYPSNQLVLDTIAETLKNGMGSAYMKPLMLAMYEPSCKVNSLGAVSFLMKNEKQLPAELRPLLVACVTDDDPATRIVALRTVQQSDLSGTDVIAAIKQMMRMPISPGHIDEAKALLSKLESPKSNPPPQ